MSRFFFTRNFWFSFSLILLLLIITVETATIIQQQQVNQKIEALSEQALNNFMRQGQPSVSNGGTRVLMRNVRFCWSKQICINTERLTARLANLKGGSTINVDAINSFMVIVENATIHISPKTLEGMFNESIFNYPGSNLRNLTVTIVQSGDGQNHVQLNGSLHYVLWIPFRMDTRLSVDPKTNTLVITVEKLKVFGILPATWLIDLRPFHLSKLLAIPQNNHLTVKQNLILVKPFGLFPPPRISGHIESITVLNNIIQLRFSGKNPGFSGVPVSGAQNYIYVYGGSTQFGRLRMAGTQLQLIDIQPKDLFQFSLLNYQNYLPKSSIKLEPSGAVVVVMPDLGNLPEGQGQPQAKNALFTKKPQAQGLWTRTKARVREMFH